MATHWANIGERGPVWGVRLMAGIYRLLGRTICEVVMAFVIAYFFLAGGQARRASLDYLNRAWKAGYLAEKPGLWTSFRHFLAFGDAILDKFAGWIGDVDRADVDGVQDGLFASAKQAGRGAFVMSAHLGNAEIIRAVAALGGGYPVNVLVHTAHAERFNRLIEQFSPESTVRLLQVTEIDMAAAMRLSAAIERGEWVVMMADRTAVTAKARAEEGQRTVRAQLLGAPVDLPQGPFLLAAALKCPAYLLFCIKRKGRYRVHFTPFGDPVVLPRTRRETSLAAHAQAFASAMEARIAEAPFQWFNFYDYWNEAAPQAHAEAKPIDIAGAEAP